MDTAVASGATCASSCFLIFAAGIHKYADYGATLGVHGVSDGNGQESGAYAIGDGHISEDL
jgi:hypothetical protein